jgi:hypothetical protein
MSKFLASFKQYFETVTDAPDLFRDTMAYTAAGTLLASRIHVDWATHTLRPGLWVVLVGPSTKIRKTTSIDVSSCVAVHGGINYTSDITRERLIGKLSEVGRIDIYASEIKQMIEAFTREYSSGLIESLTSAYDGAAVQTTRETMKNQYTVSNPISTIIAASTPEWLAETTSKHAEIGSGFLARFLIVYCPERDKPVRSAGSRNLFREKAIAGAILSVKSGPIHLTPEAQTHMNLIQERIDGMYPDLIYYSHALDRFPEHLLKLASIETVDADKVRIEPEHLDKAWAYLERLFIGLKGVETMLSQTPFANRLKQLETLIKNNKEMSFMELARKFPVKSRQEIKELLTFLEETGKIAISVRAHAGKAQQTFIYTGDDNHETESELFTQTDDPSTPVA